MTMWSPSVETRDGPMYRRIADALDDDVRSGALPAGARLPTHRDLAFRLGVTVGTVSRAYAEAERRGLIGGEVGRGTYVRSSAAVGLPTVVIGRSGDGAWPRILAHGEDGGERFELGLNYPAAAPLAAAMADILAGLATSPSLGAIAGYQPAKGMPLHREAGAAWLRQFRIEADADAVVVAPGCQGGITATLLALCRPGDLVLHESLSWPGLFAFASTGLLGLRTAPVAMDGDGLCPDALEAACRDRAPRVLYTMPTLHNPTTVVMPEARRRAIADVARRYGLWIVEDDVYGFLPDDAPVPLRMLLPELSIYVTSLSKALSPALRVGYVVAPPAVAARIAEALRMTVLTTSSLAAEAGAIAIRNGVAAAAAEAQRQEARLRQRLAARVLQGLDFATHPAAFHGWLGVPPPWRQEEFVAALRDRGVSVTPGAAFASRPAPAEATTRVRLCLCAVPDRDRLATALGIVAEVARGPAAAAMPVV